MQFDLNGFAGNFSGKLSKFVVFAHYTLPPKACHISTETKLYTLVVPPDSPCGCGSGKTFGDCHLRDGGIQMAPKTVLPKRPLTGTAVKKCLFAQFKDCWGGISGEHIVSANILRAIDERQVTIESPLFTRTGGINSDIFKTNRLCRRHNSAFSPLDEEGGRLFRALQSIETSLSEKTTLGPPLFLFSGTDIERWLLKTMYMAHFAKLTGFDPSAYRIPSSYLEYFWHSLPAPLGLYVLARTSGEEKLKLNLTKNVSTHVFADGGTIVGISVTLSGVEFLLLLQPHVIDLANYEYRPQYLNFFDENFVIGLALVWDSPGERILWLSRGEKDAPLPNNE